jgi:hypothetical protein
LPGQHHLNNLLLLFFDELLLTTGLQMPDKDRNRSGFQEKNLTSGDGPQEAIDASHPL